MYKIDDSRPALSEWILYAFDILSEYTSEQSGHRDILSISRNQAHNILQEVETLDLGPEDAVYALTRLLERGYLYEVDGEHRVTTPSK